MCGTHLTLIFFIELIFFIVSAKSIAVLIELSEDCYCNLSVPIPNEQTLV